MWNIHAIHLTLSYKTNHIQAKLVEEPGASGVSVAHVEANGWGVGYAILLLHATTYATKDESSNFQQYCNCYLHH